MFQKRVYGTSAEIVQQYISLGEFQNTTALPAGSKLTLTNKLLAFFSLNCDNVGLKKCGLVKIIEKQNVLEEFPSHAL